MDKSQSRNPSSRGHSRKCQLQPSLASSQSLGCTLSPLGLEFAATSRPGCIGSAFYGLGLTEAAESYSRLQWTHWSRLECGSRPGVLKIHSSKFVKQRPPVVRRQKSKACFKKTVSCQLSRINRYRRRCCLETCPRPVQKPLMCMHLGHYFHRGLNRRHPN